MQLSHCYFKMYGHKSQFVIGAGSSAAGFYVRIGKKKKDTANRPYPSCRGAWRSRTALAGFADQRLNRSSNAPFWKGISPAVFICGCKVSNKSANIETISLKPVLF